MSKRSQQRKDMMLFPSDVAAGWRVIRMVSRLEGELKVNEGVWRHRFDPNTTQLIGYQILGSEALRGDLDLASLPSTPAIAVWEMELNAERSRTAGLPDIRRQERVAAHLPPEDEVERVQAKVFVFPRIGAARGDILRVLPAQ
jgi:hypothetical protein